MQQIVFFAIMIGLMVSSVVVLTDPVPEPHPLRHLFNTGY